MSHISIWSILQVLACLFLEVLISNKEIQIISNGIFLDFRGLVCVVATFFIVIIGFSNFRNILLSGYTWG
jgi:hypothetical protein